MAITDQQKANALFKKFQGRADTSPYLEFYEEPLKSSFIVTPENFWIDTEYIPATAPVLEDREDFIVTFDNGFQLPVLRRYKNLYLDPVPGATASFYHEELSDALPHDYKDGSYHYVLKDAAGQELAYGLNAWVVDFQAGVLTFYQGIPEGITLPLTISFYRYIGRKTFEGVVQTDGTTPMVDEYVPSRGQDVSTKSYVDEEIAAVQEIVDKLIPDPPPGLTARSLVMQLYKAYAVGSGAEHDCTPFVRPEIHIDGPFYNGDEGTLTAFINGTVIGTHELSAADDTGTHGAIILTADEDPYAGENQRKNFHKQLRGYIRPTTALTPGQHNARIQHSTTGTTPEKVFWVDDPSPNANIRILDGSAFLPSTVSPSQLGVAYISGVPSLTTSSHLPISLLVRNVARTHYSNVMAKVTSSHVQNEDFEVTQPITSATEVITLTRNLQVRPNVYAEQLQLQPIALNSAMVPFPGTQIVRPARIDTVSNEKLRVASGTGMYPSNDNYGSEYPSAQHLKDNEELQLINGIYQWPSGDYTENIPQGPNYNNLPNPPGSIRWVTFKSIKLLHADGFTIRINGAKNWTANPETHKTANVYIFARIQNNEKPQGNKTEWLDCNEPYAGVGKPEKDGTGAMVVSGSTATIKRVSFGPTTRSGQLYIRIGLSQGNKQFSTITVTPN